MDRSIAETLGLSEVGVILVLVVIAIVLAVITRLVTASRAKKAAQAACAQPDDEKAGSVIPPSPSAPISAQCKLTNCDDATAAMIIAIVADSLGEEFNGMQVTSIKQI